ncbi:MAG: DinB family protein [Caldilineaceae bacterium]|nr:DinB family protein [Caldilineaceae bacterium]
MAERLTQMLEKMAKTHAKMLDYLATLDEAAANARHEGDGWSARETIAHLADAERAHRRFIQALVEGRPPAKVEGFDLDAWNAAKVAKRAQQSLSEVLADFERERNETLAYLPTLPDDAWELAGDHPALGHVTVEYVARIIGLHERDHLRMLTGK